ncbi:Sec-independent protein translocase protein TatB [Pseudomonas sp. R2.Fl]|nr:Sec-independent protein translocase protein TatB [Pseudomonas sp. R2.Fl]
MLDIGWSEMLVIAVVLIVVVGPKDLPPMLRAFGKMTTRLRRTAGEFRAQFDEALREAELEDVGKTISGVRRFNPGSVVREAMKPLQEAGESVRADIKAASSAVTAAAAADAKSTPLPEMPSPLPPVTSDLVPQAAPAPAEAKASKPKRSPAAKAPKPAAAAKASATATKAPASKPKATKPAAAEKPVAAVEPKTAARKAPARKKATTTAKDKA